MGAYGSAHVAGKSQTYAILVRAADHFAVLANGGNTAGLASYEAFSEANADTYRVDNSGGGNFGKYDYSAVADGLYEMFIYERLGAAAVIATDNLVVQKPFDITTTATTVSTVAAVDDSRVWLSPQDSAASGEALNVVSLQPGVAAVVAMDFTNILNPYTNIVSVDAVADVNSVSPALSIASLAVSQNRTRAHATISNITDGETYRLKFTVTTTDSQTLIAVGELKGEDNP